MQWTKIDIASLGKKGTIANQTCSNQTSSSSSSSNSSKSSSSSSDGYGGAVVVALDLRKHQLLRPLLPSGGHICYSCILMDVGSTQ